MLITALKLLPHAGSKRKQREGPADAMRHAVTAHGTSVAADPPLKKRRSSCGPAYEARRKKAFYARHTAVVTRPRLILAL